MTGFLLAVSFRSGIMLRRTTHQTRLISHTTTHHNNNTLRFNFSNHNKATHRPVFVSKQASVEFDDRKSPNQVTVTNSASYYLYSVTQKHIYTMLHIDYSQTSFFYRA
ncbi:hypothetical protein RYX36_016405 [Vicia faba]